MSTRAGSCSELTERVPARQETGPPGLWKKCALPHQPPQRLHITRETCAYLADHVTSEEACAVCGVLRLEPLSHSVEEGTRKGITGSRKIARLAWERWSMKLLPFPPHICAPRASSNDNMRETVLELATRLNDILRSRKGERLLLIRDDEVCLHKRSVQVLSERVYNPRLLTLYRDICV